jgi:hypothetical protein
MQLPVCGPRRSIIVTNITSAAIEILASGILVGWRQDDLRSARLSERLIIPLVGGAGIPRGSTEEPKKTVDDGEIPKSIVFGWSGMCPMRVSLKKFFTISAPNFSTSNWSSPQKIGTDRAPTAKQHEAVVEVPKDLVQRKEAEIMNENPREKVVVLDLARRVSAVGQNQPVKVEIKGFKTSHFSEQKTAPWNCPDAGPMGHVECPQSEPSGNDLHLTQPRLVAATYSPQLGIKWTLQKFLLDSLTVPQWR